MENINPAGLNKDVRKWARTSRNMMERKVRHLTNREKHNYIKIKKIKNIKGIRRGPSSFRSLADSIKFKVHSRFGVAERIIFPFAKHGFFIAVGASRGHPVKSNPRKKIDWYNFVFEERLDMLADIATEHYADSTMNISGIGKKA